MDYEKHMKRAIKEAQKSYREGGNGFGAVIVKDGKVVTAAHDSEYCDHDVTCHSIINAIRGASKKLGKDLSGCVLVTTHEPCAMCAAAIVIAKISEVVYGYSFRQMPNPDEMMVRLSSAEMFAKSDQKVRICEGVLAEECSILYRRDVRMRIAQLQKADDWDLKKYNCKLLEERLKWFSESKSKLPFLNGSPLDQAYQLLLEINNMSDKLMPIVNREEDRITIHWIAFCPILEACRILGLDTRRVCKRMHSGVNDAVFKEIDPHLHHEINYGALRPRYNYCEEYITYGADLEKP